MKSTAAGYVPAILFLLASGLLLSFFFLSRGSGSTSSLMNVQISTLITLVIIASLICGLTVRDRGFYAYAIAIIGVVFRAASVMLSPVSSDVLAVSAKGAALILSGQNPYEVMISTPSKFPYPPLEPLFYSLFLGMIDLRWVEFASALVIILILLLTTLRSENSGASLLYLALYCFSTLMAGFVGVSTNDTSASLFPFLAMWIVMFSSARRKFDYAGVLLGLGLAFKQFGIFPLIFAIGFLIKSGGPWLRTGVLASLTTAMLSLPFLFWNSTAFLYEIVFFNLGERPASEYYALFSLNPQFPGPWLLTLQLLLIIGLGAWMLYRIRDWSECQIAWTSVLLLSLFLGRYLAPSYFVYAMPFWILAGMMALRGHKHDSNVGAKKAS